MKCIDVAKDAIWIGKEIPIDCVNVDLCKQRGCEWRRFHELRPDQFTQKSNIQQSDLFDP